MCMRLLRGLGKSKLETGFALLFVGKMGLVFFGLGLGQKFSISNDFEFRLRLKDIEDSIIFVFGILIFYYFADRNKDPQIS